MLGELFGQMQQAKQHVERARTHIAAALTELGHANALIRRTMRGNADQSLAGLADQIQRQLTNTGQTATEIAKRIDQVLARWRGTGGPGN